MFKRKTKRKINICSNHLPDFFKALQIGDLKQINKIEHNLTKEEECVACAYIFKTKGSVRDALGTFLNEEGFEVDLSSEKTKNKILSFWIFRIAVLLIIISLLFILFTVVKYFIIGLQVSFFNLNIIEYIAILTLAIFIFLIVDDKIIE